jgi:hypothetical protein
MIMRNRKVTVMGTKNKRWLLAAGVLGSILAGAGPALAQPHGGGGGGHASGGAHFGGGGGHAAGFAHASAAHAGGGGVHYSAQAHYAGGYAAHGYAGGFHGAAYGGYRGGYAYAGRPAAYYGHGYSTGAYWRGGYWHGGFWPRAYYGIGFSWFLPVLPLAYATYWYGGIPYYYANDVYYTYDPSYEGYVATDPPPVTESGAGPDASAPAAPPPGQAPAAMPAAQTTDGGPVPGQVFMYPKNGQSAEQQATDKAACQQWAQQQAGQVAQNGSDYQRAMIACVEGRGYSAQ